MLNFIKTVVADQMTLTGMNTNSISKNDQIDAIWANTKLNGKTAIYQGSLKNLTPKSDEEILELFNQLPEEEEVAEVSIDDLVASTDITAFLNTKGEQYLCIGLPLVETNGLSFKFKYQDATVVVASDMDLYKLHKTNPIAIGTVMQFNYEGSDTFKKLDSKGLFLVANNSVDNPFRGTLNKSNNECFASILALKAVVAMERQIAVMETAEEHGVTARKVRQIMSANLSADISASMKAKLNK